MVGPEDEGEQARAEARRQGEHPGRAVGLGLRLLQQVIQLVEAQGTGGTQTALDEGRASHVYRYRAGGLDRGYGPIGVGERDL